MSDNHQFIHFFRQAAPYIHQHRDKTFVFCLQDNHTSEQQRQSILHDIAILHSLRVKVIIVFGARHSINQRLSKETFYNNRRITTLQSMQAIQEIVGALQIKVQAMLSMGLANSPMQGATIQTSSGNFIIAKPIGVIDGVDHGLTGTVRKIRAQAINQKLEQGEIVIIPPIGYSTTGESFNLTTEEVASEVAIAIKADKLLFLNEEVEVLFNPNSPNRSLTPQQAKNTQSQDITLQSILLHAAQACENGVNRTHLIQKNIDGASIVELFTRDGLGLMVTNEAYDRIEQACINDIPSLLALIRPAEEQGILVRRSRELLEMEIAQFYLLKRDNSVIGSAALYPYPEEKIAELGCLVINADYQKGGRADVLLAHIEASAKDKGIEKLFCLTTRTSHWFIERGFKAATLNDLPIKKRAMYNYTRGSKPYIKVLV